MIDNKNNGESYCVEFRNQIARGLGVLKERGYRPMMASEMELIFSDIQQPEKISAARNDLIQKITAEIASPDFKDIDQKHVQQWFKQNSIPYDEAKHGNTQKRFVDLLAREVPATIPELLMFHMQEINPKTRDILEYQYGHYEDAVDVYEIRLKPTDPVEWCKNFRTLKNEIIALPKKVTADLDLHYQKSSTNHTHISMHHGGEGVEHNLAANTHPEHLTTYKKFIELQTKAAFDGHYFLKNSDDSRKDDDVEREQGVILLPTRPSNLRNTGYSTEIRVNCSESHQTPELTALLFCVAPMLAATKQSPAIDAAYEKGEIIKAQNIKKLQVPKPIHHERGKYFEAVPYFRQHMHSFLQLNGRDKVDFVGPPLMQDRMDTVELMPELFALVQDCGMLSRENFVDLSRKNEALNNKMRVGGDSSEARELFNLSLRTIEDSALEALKAIDNKDSRIFSVHVDDKKPVTLNDANDPRYKDSWEIVNKKMPTLRKYIKELADGAVWVDRLAVYNDHSLQPFRAAYQEAVCIPRFPKTPAQRKALKDGVDALLDGVATENGRNGGRFMNSPIFQEAFADIAEYGGAQSAMRSICRYGRDMLNGKIAYPCGKMFDETQKSQARS